MMPDPRETPSPNGCRHCGEEERDHARVWLPDIGWHTWQAPTDAQRLERMRRRKRWDGESLYTEPCTVCREPIFWQPCPTGGWWVHVQHPENGHDASFDEETYETHDDW